MSTMIYDTLHANKAYTGNTKVSHEFFLMNLAEVRIFHHLVMLACILQRQVVLWQLLGFKRFLQTCFTKWTECKALLLDLDETHLTKGMTTVEISWYSVITIEIFVARGALHFN